MNLWLMPLARSNRKQGKKIQILITSFHRYPLFSLVASLMESLPPIPPLCRPFIAGCQHPRCCHHPSALSWPPFRLVPFSVASRWESLHVFPSTSSLQVRGCSRACGLLGGPSALDAPCRYIAAATVAILLPPPQHTNNLWSTCFYKPCRPSRPPGTRV